MNREAALDTLPEPYARALRLCDDGWADAEISAAVGVETDALPTLFELAERKLAHAIERRG